MRFDLPRGFARHDGSRCPFDPNSFVETLILTAEGVGSGGVTRACMHETWEWSKPDLGDVVGYRSARGGESAVVPFRHRIRVAA